MSTAGEEAEAGSIDTHRRGAGNRPLLGSPLHCSSHQPAHSRCLEILALSQKTQRTPPCSQGVSAGPLLPLWPLVCHALRWGCYWGVWPHCHPQLPGPRDPHASLAVVFLGLASCGVDAISCCWAVPLGFSCLCNLMAGAWAALHNGRGGWYS